MKRGSCWFKAITAVVFSALLWVPSTASLAAAATTVKVPFGTPVTLRLDTAISPERNNSGDAVSFSVVSDVIVDGKVVIPAGSKAIGQVVKAKKRGYIGLPASIFIQVTSIQSSAGNAIPIGVSKESEGESKLVLTIVLSILCCVLFLLMKGGDIELPAGTVLNATTTAPIEIQVL